MHFHLPKPLHGWREFVGEVGIIVIGILIALSAEQIIEKLHWREKVGQANEQLRIELHANAQNAYGWLAVHGCLLSQLDAADRAVSVARETGESPPTTAYSPELSMFTSDAWLTARSLQVADHMEPGLMHDYALVYFFPRELETDIVQLHQFASELRPLVGGLHRVSSEEAGTYQRLISKTRELQERTALAGALLLDGSSRLGIKPSAREMQEAVKIARQKYGACAGPPNSARVARSG